jgi:hypothetical protein
MKSEKSILDGLWWTLCDDEILCLSSQPLSGIGPQKAAERSSGVTPFEPHNPKIRGTQVGYSTIVRHQRLLAANSKINNASSREGAM